jgi:AraC-like DNA-binding protein
MKVLTLPEDLDISLGNIQVYNYFTEVSHEKSMVKLQMNTISFLQEGSKEVYSKNHPVNIGNEAFLMMRSGHLLMTEKLSPLTGYNSLLLFFSDELLDQFIQKHVDVDQHNDATEFAKAFVYDAFICQVVLSLKELLAQPETFRSKVLTVKFEEIMLYLLETQKQALLNFITVNLTEYTLNMIRVVEGNTLKKLSLAQLAFLSNMSVSTFKREFEKQFKQSPSKWFQEKRLEHAAFLLKSKGKRPSDIYILVGYESLTNFVQAFKNHFGTTPKQF